MVEKLAGLFHTFKTPGVLNSVFDTQGNSVFSWGLYAEFHAKGILELEI